MGVFAQQRLFSAPFRGPVQGHIEERLTSELRPLHLEVVNESHGKKSDESHFHVLIVSEAFEGLKPLARHRLVNGLFTREDGSLKFHSLRITAKTPAMWEEEPWYLRVGCLSQASSFTGQRATCFSRKHLSSFQHFFDKQVQFTTPSEWLPHISPGREMEETIGAATEERTRDSVDDRQQEETAEKMRRDRQLQFLTNWVSEHKVVRPELVRSIYACQALDFFGSAFRTGSVQKLDKLHKKSKATGRIDEFWSHSWQKRPYQKVLCLLFLKNGFAASLIGTLAASIVYTFMHNGMLLIRLDDRINSRGEHLGLPFLCTVIGTLVAVLTLFMWRSRIKVFLDVCCIDQVNAKNKQEGILSLCGILSKCKTLLILWDETYIERLWCVFEIAAFAHRSGKPRTAIKPTLLGKAALAVYAGTPAMALLNLEFMNMKYRWSSSYVILGAFVVSFYWGVASFRSYHYSIEILRRQLQNFRLEDTKCNCCTRGHVGPDGETLSCDREVVERCICIWFGSVEQFELFIVPLLRSTFEKELGQHTFPYIYFLVVFCPVVWAGMDLTAGHRWGGFWMFQFTGYWWFAEQDVTLLAYRAILQLFVTFCIPAAMLFGMPVLVRFVRSRVAGTEQNSV
ncbi:unnamed protein product [Symbiodinium sp. KB8]|nr:unnamed protein product [Symbiodinium sp. KB8]